jgi:hypothetical protein
VTSASPFGPSYTPPLSLGGSNPVSGVVNTVQSKLAVTSACSPFFWGGAVLTKEKQFHICGTAFPFRAGWLFY